jgi:hypothetical protein
MVGAAVAIGLDNILDVNVLDAVVPLPAFNAVTDINIKERPSTSVNL